MKRALHFVGFRGDEYSRACRVFGQPDFVHCHWDRRAVAEFCAGDVAVFSGSQAPEYVEPFTYDDSARF